MSTLAVEEAVTPLDTVRRFFAAVRTGRAVDALELFAQDGEVRDAEGGEHHGIRAIAAFTARNRFPASVEVEDLRQGDDRVVATVRRDGGSFRHTFAFRGERIVSLRIDALTGTRARPRTTRVAPAGA